MAQSTLITDKEKFIRNAFRFLEILFGENPGSRYGEIEIRTFPKGGIPEQYFFGKPQDPGLLAYDLSNSGVDAYFGVNPRVGKQGKKESVHYLVAFHAEVDYGTDGHRKESKYHSHDEALKAIENFELQPTLLNHSGGGFHCYWVLNEPVNVKDVSVKALESVNRSLSDKLGGDIGTQDLGRVLRIPGTYNFKLEGNPREVTAVITDDLKYDYEQFTAFAAMEESEPKPAYPKVPAQPASLENEGMNGDRVLALPVSEHIKNLILHGNDGTYPSRSEADQAVITALVSKARPHPK